MNVLWNKNYNIYNHCPLWYMHDVFVQTQQEYLDFKNEWNTVH